MDAAARYQKLKDLLAKAQEVGYEDRAAILAEASGDPELKRELEQLLGEEPSADRFFAGLSGKLATLLRPANWPRTFAVDELVAERYRVVAFLGAGGMGEVYEAEDLALRQEHVALKTLPMISANDERAVDRLKREIATARRVTHPNVCRVFDVGQHKAPSGPPITFFTMELLKGKTLAEKLNQGGTLSTDAALPIVKQMAAALGAAHAAQIVHGDFKPGNVMIGSNVDGTERVVVTDFGLARHAPLGSNVPSTVTASVGWGTPAYMAPEQFDGHSATYAADIYALGAVIRSMVVGPPPEAAGALENLDARWRKTIGRCLERDPSARFKAAGDVVASLEESPRRTWRIGLAAAAVMSLVVIALAASGLIPAPANVFAAQRTVALLPFTGPSQTADSAAYGQGLVSVLTEQLQRASASDHRLWFVPAAEVIRGGLMTPVSLHRTLGVDWILTGRLDRDERRTAITVDLLDASSGATAPRKSQTVEVAAGHRAALAPMLDKLTQLIGLKLESTMLQALTAGGTAVPEAEELYVRGRGFLMLRPAGLDAAIDALQRAVGLDNGYALAHAALGDAYLRKYRVTLDPGLIQQAQASGDKAIALNPSLPYAHVVMGRLYRRTGQQERAIRELEAALQSDPNAVDAEQALAEAYEADGDLEAAERVYQRQVERHTQYWNAHEDLGTFQFRHGRYREAEISFLNGLKYAPDNVVAIGNLAGVYILTERFAAAESELNRGVRLAPDVRMYNNLSWVYIFQGRFQEAVAPMEQAVRLPGADSFHWGNLARVYRWANYPERAKETYLKAVDLARQEIRVNPTDAWIRANLAYLLAETGQRAEGLAEISSTLERAPKDMVVVFKSALVYELTGDRSGALRALEVAAKGGHSVVEIRRHPDLASLREDPRYLQVVGAARGVDKK